MRRTSLRLPPGSPETPAENPRTVFIGDSITYRWFGADAASGHRLSDIIPGCINAGVPGESPPEILARMYSDVIEAGAARVIINGGANGLEDDHPTQWAQILQCAQIALDSGLRTYVGTLTPGVDRPQAGVLAFNAHLLEAQAYMGFGLIDYYATMVAPNGLYFDASLYQDTVHPNPLGYARMESALRRKLRL